MQLYIKVENGQPVGHPLLKENLLQVFPGIDLVNNPEYVQFERVPAPAPGPYDKYITGQYALVDGIYRDVWIVEPMSADERIQKQNQTKIDWQQTEFLSWIFNEETCEFEPPIPYPTDTLNYYEWHEATQTWTLVPKG